MIQITIPGVVPSVNHMYKDKWIRGVKYRIYTKEAEDWMLLAQTMAYKEKHSSGWITVKRGSKIVVEFIFFLPDKRDRDNHNGLKIILDALQGIVYENDYFALPRVMDFHVDKLNPRVEIRSYILQLDS